MILAITCLTLLALVLIAMYVASRRLVRAQGILLDKQERAISELNAYTSQLNEALKAREDSIADLEKERAKLEPLRKILDIEEAIRERREQYLQAENDAKNRAKAKLEEIRATIRTEKSRHDAELEEARRRISEKLAEATAQCELLVSSARLDADNIIRTANTRAESIAGDAIAAVREARELESVARAMRNVIAGYGDEYLVPNTSVLDDLADDFSHKEAGLKLKAARSRTRELVKSGLAAECNYVEPKRRETAIHFVLDAFNGKVDSILSTVKTDNFGKLHQEIVDAQSIVNHNGRAFREARISTEYLDARLEELKWAVAVVELKQLEREEQRAIQQAMREEEKARREYEKAIRDAQREEELLQKAMNQARRELAAASDEKRKVLESQLAELESKLAEAEARNQRAISMAQQTKRGHVYIISNVGSFGDNVYKIGMTRRLEPEERIRELGDASVPFEFDIHAMIFSEDAPKLESEIHRALSMRQVNKVNPRKEFFRVEIAEVRKLCESRDIAVHWTMVAEAREYWESQAIERTAHTNLAS